MHNPSPRRRRAAFALVLGLAACRSQSPVQAPATPGAAAVPSATASAPLTTTSGTPQRFGAVDAARMARLDREPGEWPTPGGDGTGAYFSRLTQIDDRNVGRLGYAWQYDLGTRRGQEATPVIVDGVMYTAGNWGRVYALDAATGRELWTFMPPLDPQWGRFACCDIVNRGVAVWQGRVLVASLDGFLYALDAATGRTVWKADTLPGRAATDFRYFSTGAPVIAGSLVVIGNGGGDFRGARGSVAAFDLETGAPRWRFYTVPRDPRLGAQDQAHLAAALATWPKDYDWSAGAGAAVWDGLSYDPALDLVYFGTGNPAPYFIGKDAPSGDLLYAASIVAVHARDGSLAWHYQEVPGDGWDYDATAKLVLTEREIRGQRRRVVMQAAKNGYFYMLDRASGELLSADPYAFVNWTRGLDAAHRPIRNSAADYAGRPALVFPAMTGAHNWQPMSVSAATGLAYIPVIDAPMVYIDTHARRAGYVEGTFEVTGLLPEFYDPAGLESLMGPLPPLAELAARAGRPAESRGVLRAFDPATGRVAWERAGVDIWDGGILSTAGNLVFRGDVAGHLTVYAADSGRILKQLDIGTSIMAAPATYLAGGRQFVAVAVGYGGGNLAMPYPKESAALRFGNEGRIVAFALDGGPVPTPAPLVETPPPSPPPREGDAASIARGEMLYNRFCGRCHVFGQGLLPDLRTLSPVTQRMFYDIVLNGAYGAKGMARWDDVLSRADAEAIHAYLIDQAWAAQASGSANQR